MKIHLMFKSGPSSFCGWYLPDHRTMHQTFSLRVVTCKNCIRYLLKVNRIKKLTEHLEGREK